MSPVLEPPCPRNPAVDEDTMTTLTHHEDPDLREGETLTRGGRRAMGRPLLFAVLLSVASLVVLGLLVAGPALPLAAAMPVAAGAAVLVILAWALAGPRL